MSDVDELIELTETGDDEEPRMINVRCIAGVAEIASLFAVSKTTAANWYARRDRNGHPEAIAYLACGTLFDINEVVRWYAGYKPLKGGRPGNAPRSVEGRYVPAS
jgi:hypothetical protein